MIVFLKISNLDEKKSERKKNSILKLMSRMVIDEYKYFFSNKIKKKIKYFLIIHKSIKTICTI